MSCFTVRFIGKEYNIPHDVLTYVELLEFTDEIKKQLIYEFISMVKNRVKNQEVGLIDDKDRRTGWAIHCKIMR